MSCLLLLRCSGCKTCAFSQMLGMKNKYMVSIPLWDRLFSVLRTIITLQFTASYRGKELFFYFLERL